MIKTLAQIIKEIKPLELYTPMQIAENKWLYGFGGENAYFAVLDLIKLGRIKAKDFGKRRTPYYKVLGSDLIKYTETFS